jgi:hypothetical protein
LQIDWKIAHYNWGKANRPIKHNGPRYKTSLFQFSTIRACLPRECDCPGWGHLKIVPGVDKNWQGLLFCLVYSSVHYLNNGKGSIVAFKSTRGFPGIAPELPRFGNASSRLRGLAPYFSAFNFP